MTSYPEYKSSGVDWLGEIPTHWQASRLKMFSKIYSGGTPDTKEKKYWENGTVPWIASGEVNQELITEVTTYITKEALKNSSAKWIPKNAIVMALAGQGRTKGTVALTGVEVTCNQSLAAIVTKNTNYKYLFYWLKSKYQDIRGLVGEDRDGLNLDLIGAISIPIPLLAEQQKIVDFLDYKMGQCDRFISNRQKQIELLNEQKAAIINKAVTKGINPNAKMKPSGIDWIGSINENWEIQKLKYLCEHISIPAFSKKQDETYIALENIEGWTGKFIFNEEFSGFDSTARKFTDKDILFGKLRPYLAKVAIPDFKGVCVSEIIVLRPIKLLREILYFMLLNADFIDFVSQTAEGTKMPRTSWNKIADLKFPLPSKEEQQAVLDFIKQETSKIEALISKYQKQIELMQEYRTALISQAVTGKIDVRDWKPQTK